MYRTRENANLISNTVIWQEWSYLVEDHWGTVLK